MFTRIQFNSIIYLFIILVFLIGVSSDSYAKVGIAKTYMDNGRCLVQGNVPCEVDSFRTEDGITFKWALGTFKDMYVSQGRIYFRFAEASKSAYSEWMTNSSNISELGWRKVLGNNDYDIKIDNDSKLTVSMVIESNDKKSQKFAKCNQDAPLRLGTSLFVNDYDKKITVNCEIESGWWPVSITIKGLMSGKVRKYQNTGDPRRVISVPGGSIKVWAEGCTNWTQAMGCNSSWVSTENQPHYLAYLAPAFIKLNDRQCNVKMDDLIEFGNNISSNSIGLVKEIGSKMDITCSGFEKTFAGETDKVSGVGIKNNIYAIKIKASDSLPNNNSNKTIGLKTDGKVRSDLYVEGTFESGNLCGVNALLTNGTAQSLPKEIRLDGTGDSQTVPEQQQPVIYWKLCNPTNQKLGTGAFDGQADVSIVYE